METETEKLAQGIRTLCWFGLGENSYGVNLADVAEVKSGLEITAVHQVSSFIRGVVNLRGEIVTILDLRKRLGLPEPEHVPKKLEVIFVHLDGETVGLLVDKIADILEIDAEKLEPPPSNVSGVDGDFFQAVHKEPDQLIAVLNLKEVLDLGAEGK